MRKKEEKKSNEEEGRKKEKRKKKGLIKKGKIPFSNKVEIKIFTCEVEFHRCWETCKNRRGESVY